MTDNVIDIPLFDFSNLEEVSCYRCGGKPPCCSTRDLLRIVDGSDNLDTEEVVKINVEKLEFSLVDFPIR